MGTLLAITAVTSIGRAGIRLWSAWGDGVHYPARGLSLTGKALLEIGRSAGQRRLYSGSQLAAGPAVRASS